MDNDKKTKVEFAGWLMPGVAIAWGICLIVMFYLRR
jgi:hypothetical protein